MMQQWLTAYDVRALCERMHTVDSLRRFLRREGTSVATRFVHIMGHGTHEGPLGTATLDLTFGKLDVAGQADVFAGLTGKVIIFSCCDVGGDRRAMAAELTRRLLTRLRAEEAAHA